MTRDIIVPSRWLKHILKFMEKNPELSAIATCFGGGIAGKGLICGAVSGSLMSLGLHFNRLHPDEKELYGELRTKAQELIDCFQQEKGSINCKDHIGYDLTTMEGRQQLHEDKEAHERCKLLLATASRLLVQKLR